MATLYRPDGTPIEVPDDQVLDALASGQYGLPKGSKLRMVNQEGAVYEMDPADAVKLAGEGWQYETEQMRRAREVQEKYGDSEGTAALLGGLRGLTFGLSDVALQDLGLVDRETLSGLKEANPDASTAGEIAAIAGSLLAGPGSLMGRVGVAPRAAAAVGRAAERGVARVVGEAAGRGLAARVAARALPAATGAAVEGALYGAGQYVSEAALGDIEGTAEDLLGHVGMGALVGGIAGGALTGGAEVVGSALRTAGRSTKAVAKRLAEMAGAKGKAADMAAEALTKVEGKINPLGEAYIKTAGKLTGEKEAFEQLLRRRQALMDAVAPDETIDQFAFKMADIQNTLDDAADDIIFKATGKHKASVMRDIASEGDGATVFNAVLADDGLLTGLQRQVDDMITAGRGTYEFQGPLKRLRDYLKGARRKLEKAEGAFASGDRQAIGEAFNMLDDFKRTLGHLRDRMSKAYSYNRLPEMAETMDVLSGLYKNVQHTLEDATLWGEKAATMQQAVNRKWTQYLEREAQKLGYKFRTRFKEKNFGEVSAREGQFEYVNNPAGWRQFVRDLGDEAKVHLDKDYILTQLRRREELLEEMVKQYDMPGGLEALKKYQQARKAFLENFERTSEIMQSRAALERIDKAAAKSGILMGAGALTGGLVAGLPGMLIGGAASSILRPGTTMRMLATLRRISGDFEARLGGKLRVFFDQAKRGTTRAKRFVGPGAVILHGNDEQRQKWYTRKLGELQRIHQQINRTAERLEDANKQIANAAPRVALAVNQKVMGATRFLLEKAPKNPQPHSILARKWRPSPSELSKWARYVRAVDNPASVLDDLAAGRLTHEAVEALREVYPRMYERLVNEVVANMDKIQDTMNYQQRVQLSLLLGIPVDPTMAPEFVASMQQAQMSMPSPESVTTPPTPVAAAVAKIEPEKLLTGTQALEARRT